MTVRWGLVGVLGLVAACGGAEEKTAATEHSASGAPSAGAPAAAPCNVTFCDDFERATVGENWGLEDVLHQSSIGERAYTGQHSAQFLAQEGVGGQGWWNHTFDVKSSVDLSFAFYPAASVGGPDDYASVARVFVTIPTNVNGNGAYSMSALTLMIAQKNGAIGLYTWETGESPDADAFHPQPQSLPLDQLRPLSAGWHVVRVTVDVQAQTAMLAIDDIAGAPYPLKQSPGVIQGPPEPPGAFFIGPYASSALVAFENDFDDIRLDAK